MPDQLPMPPPELRRSVGDASFDNPTGALIYPGLPVAAYERVFDFGCGCGRLARQLMQQQTGRPKAYLGIDLNKPAIDWASANLGAIDSSYRFSHFDVFNLQFNPGASVSRQPFPTDETFSLAIAHSVFTHILEADVQFYLQQVARVLANDSFFVSTWFLFDKTLFPMMQEFQNALYIQVVDPTNAVVYDREFVRALFRAAGLTIIHASPPSIRGFQWTLVAVPGNEKAWVDFPEDKAPIGLARPPVRLYSQSEE